MRTSRRALLLACCSIPVVADGTGVGPFCWAGQTPSGEDKFIPCFRKRHELTLQIDPPDFGGLRVIIAQRVIVISREQFLAALEGWAAETRAKP